MIPRDDRSTRAYDAIRTFDFNTFRETVVYLVCHPMTERYGWNFRIFFFIKNEEPPAL